MPERGKEEKQLGDWRDELDGAEEGAEVDAPVSSK